MARPGSWLVTCDRCGKEFPASEAFHEYTGLIVCADDIDPRHPSEVIPYVPENMNVPWTRPEGPDVFVEVEISREDL